MLNFRVNTCLVMLGLTIQIRTEDMVHTLKHDEGISKRKIKSWYEHYPRYIAVKNKTKTCRWLGKRGLKGYIEVTIRSTKQKALRTN